MVKLRAISIPLIIVVGVISTITLSHTIYRRVSDKIDFEFERAALDRSLALQRSISSAVLVGQSIVSFFTASEYVTRSEFSTYSKVFLREVPYVQALEWVPRVTDVERQKFETQAAIAYPGFYISERNDARQLVLAGERSEYFPVFYLEPVQGNEKALGYDLASDPSRLEALYQTRDSNKATATERINLVQTGADRWGVLVFFPLYNQSSDIESLEKRRVSFNGAVVVVFDIERLVETALEFFSQAGIAIVVRDSHVPQDESLLYARGLSGADTAFTSESLQLTNQNEMVFIDNIEVANRMWSLQMTPAEGYYKKAATLEVYIVAIGGILATILMAAYVRQLQNREFQLRKDKGLLEKMVAERTQKLEEHNKELEAYSYSIAHDLRSPLRTITSFTQILKEDAYHKLNDEERKHLQRIIKASKYLAQLIDDILELSRITRSNVELLSVDLSDIARQIAERFQSTEERAHQVNWKIQENLYALCDQRLLTVVLENLLGNAHKFTNKIPNPQIEFGATQENGKQVFYVKDNGIGFDNKYAGKLFGVFQRLHSKDEYEGTGIGLATVQRIITRHGGKIWANAKPGEGANFYFTLSESSSIKPSYS